MNESLFLQQAQRLWPVLSLYVKEHNEGKGIGKSYLFKQFLRTVFSPDLKWESTTANTQFVSASVIATDSPLPISQRPTLTSAQGDLPKLGMKRIMNEQQINTLNTLIARASVATTEEAQQLQQQQILVRLADDANAVNTGIDELIEALFLSGLSDGCIGVDDDKNIGTALRVDFGYFDSHTFGCAVKGTPALEDIKKVIAEADTNGDTITTIMLARSTYDRLRQTRWAKELVATYNGQRFGVSDSLPVPSSAAFDAAFADDNGGIVFRTVDRSVKYEKNGRVNSYKPWNADRLIFLTQADVVGSLVWGTPAEATNPVTGVLYQTMDNYKLISRYSKNEPSLQDVTAAQAMAIPVIENVDQIYVLDLSIGADDVQTENDDDFDLDGETYAKDDVIEAMSTIGSPVGATVTDAQLLEAINALSKAKKTKLLELLAAAAAASAS